MIIIAVEIILINQMRNWWLICLWIYINQFLQHFGILLNGTTQYLCIRLLEIMDGLGIFAPHFRSDEGRIYEKDIKLIFQFFRQMKWLVKIIKYKILLFEENLIKFKQGGSCLNFWIFDATIYWWHRKISIPNLRLIQFSHVLH